MYVIYIYVYHPYKDNTYFTRSQEIGF